MITHTDKDVILGARLLVYLRLLHVYVDSVNFRAGIKEQI